MGGGLLTDLYELNMASSYLRRGMRGPATFSLFVRQLPPDRGFLVAAGIDQCLAWLERFSFDEEDLSYLAGLGYDDATLAAFGGLRFTGDVWAVAEGRIVFAGEPLLEVTAPIAEAQLVETYLLNQVTFQTAVASKAARCRLAAAGRVDLVEFGFRRSHGVEAGIAVARAAAMVGFTGTSNVEAARRYGLHPSGTMAHAYVEAFPTEVDAFRAYVSDIPATDMSGAVTFLVDTYDTLAGVAHAIAVIGELGPVDQVAVRLDSGDLATLTRDARRMLDAAGMPHVRIFVSGGLDEHDIARLVADGAPVDAAGIGTRLAVSADAPFLDSVYKLVSYDGRPVMKLSPAKATLPGAKQVFRAAGLHDALGLRSEPSPPGTAALLEPVMAAGRRREAAATVAEAALRFETDLSELPGPARALRDPERPTPRVTEDLARLAQTVRALSHDAGTSPPRGPSDGGVGRAS